MKGAVLWHGYPQEADAHPDRPWWKKHALEKPTEDGGKVALVGWIHPSGVFAYGADAAESMAKYDAEYPLPPPEPKGGQVWVDQVHGSERTVTRIERPNGTDKLYVWLGTERMPGEWPPKSCALVAGPFSPWAPTGAE